MTMSMDKPVAVTLGALLAIGGLAFAGYAQFQAVVIELRVLQSKVDQVREEIERGRSENRVMSDEIISLRERVVKLESRK